MTTLTKHHGLGNDFLVAFDPHVADLPAFARRLCQRTTGVGADGLLIEVHSDPDHAKSDGAQSLYPTQFERLMAELRIIAPAIGRSICLEPVARRGWAR